MKITPRGRKKTRPQCRDRPGAAQGLSATRSTRTIPPEMLDLLGKLGLGFPFSTGGAARRYRNGVATEAKGWLASRFARLSTGLKMLLILSAALFPLGLIAILVSIESARREEAGPPRGDALEARAQGAAAESRPSRAASSPSTPPASPFRSRPRDRGSARRRFGSSSRARCRSATPFMPATAACAAPAPASLPSIEGAAGPPVRNHRPDASRRLCAQPVRLRRRRRARGRRRIWPRRR